MLESHPSTRTLCLQGSKRVLEDPREIELKNQDVVVGWLSGLRKQVGGMVMPDYGGVTLSFSNHVTARALAAQQLYWSHVGAMRWLQGMPVPAILGDGRFLLQGQATKPGDPLPGFVRPILVQVQDNPEEVELVEIYKLVWRDLGL